MQALTKTRTKTYRLSLITIDQLNIACKRSNMTENELVNETLTGRLFIDPLIPTFRWISLDSETMSRLLAAANVDVLETAASELAQRNFPIIRQLYRASERPLEFREFCTILLAQLGGWFHVEGHANNVNKLIFYHQYGLKWSRFLKPYLTTAYSTISKGKLDIEIDERFIQVNFQ